MTVRILHIEDSAADVELVTDILASLGADVMLESAEDGGTALEILRRQGAHTDAVRPDLILLDLNLPKKTGREVLQAVRSDPEIRGLPVIVLTTSRADSDVRSCYDLGASAYLVKPSDLEGMRRVLGGLKAFWIDVAALARPEGVRVPLDACD